MSHTAYPDLSKSTAQLAASTTRVAQFVDGLASRVDKLVEAALAEDWMEVRRLGEYLTRSSETYGCPHVSACAKRLCDELDKPNNHLAIQQSLVRLIGACGSAPGAPPQRSRLRNRKVSEPIG